jgi:thiamine transport system ATP-binding protein
MLRVEGLRLAQGAFRLSADFQVEKGARVAVMGPSGAGKSTLLAAIAGFAPHEAGRVLWEGRDLTPLPPGARPVGMIFQDQNLFPHLTIAENAGLGLRPARKLSAEERARVKTALARVGIAHLAQKRPGEISGGEQSRAALARFLLQARPLALLDEAFSALGPALKAEMLDLVAELSGETGATLLFVTHDPGDARRIATHAMLVEAGEVSPPVEAAALFANPPEAFRRYLGRR